MGILKPATALRVSKDIDGDDIDDYKRGLIFGGGDDVTAGFPAQVEVGVSATRLCQECKEGQKDAWRDAEGGRIVVLSLQLRLVPQQLPHGAGEHGRQGGLPA